MIKLALMGFFVAGLYAQVKFPHLNVHCALLNFLTNVLWLLTQG